MKHSMRYANMKITAMMSSKNLSNALHLVLLSVYQWESPVENHSFSHMLHLGHVVAGVFVWPFMDSLFMS